MPDRYVRNGASAMELWFPAFVLELPCCTYEKKLKHGQAGVVVEQGESEEQKSKGFGRLAEKISV